MNFLDERLPTRFWSKCTPEPNSGCWLWTGAGSQGDTGYGRFMVGGRDGRLRLAHRYAYEVLVGGTPLQLDHLCRTRRCVNPAHLEPVTCRENILRGAGLAALNAKKNFCVNGHAFDETNTRVTKTGGRACRACARALAVQARASMLPEQRKAMDAKYNAKRTDRSGK